jgi:hypothetical protein
MFFCKSTIVIRASILNTPSSWAKVKAEAIIRKTVVRVITLPNRLFLTVNLETSKMIKAISPLTSEKPLHLMESFMLSTSTLSMVKK